MILLEYQNIQIFFRKAALQVFVIKTVKNIVAWTYVNSDPNREETLCKKELEKTKQREFRIEKVIKRNGDELYVKWKGYNNSFNSSIARKKTE